MQSEKLEALRAAIRNLGSTLVAYSGGVDSALVLAVAHEQLGEQALGVTALSASLPNREQRAAAELAEHLGARHRFVGSAELDNPAYARNHSDRCFHCKTELYTRLQRIADAEGFTTLCNGTNLDDLGDHRPGLRAAEAAGVRSPLLEARIDKATVRALAQELGLSCWNKPAAACLSSRIPYGTPVTQERLGQVERLEDALLGLGLSQVRVRHHGPVARLELTETDMPVAMQQREAIVQAARVAGFTFAALDLAGYRSGSLNALPVLRR